MAVPGDDWVACPRCRADLAREVRGGVPGERYWDLLHGLLRAAQVSGPLVTDAAPAALAIEHGATLCTTDRDFSRFPGLRTLNPLAP
jgi:predicted nucleic acid-binding protein